MSKTEKKIVLELLKTEAFEKRLSFDPNQKNCDFIADGILCEEKKYLLCGKKAHHFLFSSGPPILLLATISQWVDTKRDELECVCVCEREM